MKTPGFARELRRGEELQVDALLTAAFGGKAEAELVHKLRKSRALAGEQVLPLGDQIVGYYALSNMVAPKGWLALAPVAIAPEFQRHGYGKRMIGMLSEWARLSRSTVVVLGDPAFYGRAGFLSDRAKNLRSAYPNDHLLLAGAADDAPALDLRYPAAFDGV